MTAPRTILLHRVAFLCAVPIVVALVLPVLVIIPIALSDSSFFVLPENGLSLRWFLEVWHDQSWWDAAGNSFVVAICATALAVVLGVPAAAGIVFSKARLSSVLYSVMLAPMVMPVIILAIAVYISYNAWGLTSSRMGLIFAHTALGLPFVVVSVVASLRKYDTRLYAAALSLGANPRRAFWHAVLPSIGSSTLIGALYAFNVSFDEAILVLFLARPEQVTLPQKIFSGLTDNITPEVAVVSLAVSVVSILLLLLMVAMQRLQSRPR